MERGVLKTLRYWKLLQSLHKAVCDDRSFTWSFLILELVPQAPLSYECKG